MVANKGEETTNAIDSEGGYGGSSMMCDSEGASKSSTASISKEDSNEYSLLMPEMANLESSGRHCSTRVTLQGKKNYTIFSGVSRFCSFRVK